ncbi:co-chaperone YbbN [Loktanella sp. 5RATIMAR09]|uniref:thioredoxin family protein n=1 Tax=Loktanella sp. 5RATIMAR09 TaxID=1225655 RepID=UPI000A666BAA|nr:co-chaperone YbbN [Loktanella sp. 5RATIMAR09]
MLELDANANAGAAADLIKDGTDASFAKDVIEASQTVPVIVDFWAPWCGPCKTLGPAIEAAVTNAKGRVKLVKIDVDANQAYAGQLQVQSIPTVYAFYQGRPVDGFQGALPPSEINAFVDKVAALAGDPEAEGLSAAIEAAEQMLADGAATDAAETFAAILQEEPHNAPAYAGLVRAYLAMDDVDQAEAILNGAPAEISTDPLLEAVHAQIMLAREAANAGPVAELQAAVEAEPDNHQARFDLATALHASGQVEEAVNTLLELFRRDREWNDGAAKAQLFKIFDAHDAKDPIVLNGRRKLSSMIFA